MGVQTPSFFGKRKKLYQERNLVYENPSLGVFILIFHTKTFLNTENYSIIYTFLKEVIK